MPRLFGGWLVIALCTCGPAPCPNDLPASCPAPAPGYQAQIAPLIANRCGRCHGPGGPAQTIPLVNYDAVYVRRSVVLTQVYGCKMPPAGEPTLSSEERAALLGWLVCGSHNN